MPLLLLLFHPIRRGTQVDLAMVASQWRMVPGQGRCLKTGRWRSVTQENLTTSSESKRESKGGRKEIACSFVFFTYHVNGNI